MLRSCDVIVKVKICLTSFMYTARIALNFQVKFLNLSNGPRRVGPRGQGYRNFEIQIGPLDR